MRKNSYKSFIDLVIISCSAKLLLANHNRYFKGKGLYFNWGLPWNMLNPLIIVIGFAILFSTGIRGQGRDLEYFLFLILLWFGFSQIVTQCITFNPNKFFMSKRKINIWILIFSEGASLAVPLFLRLLICMFAMTFFGFYLEFYHLFYGYFMLSTFAFLYGCIMRTFLSQNSFFTDAHSFFITGLFFVSSIIIPVPLLPENIRNILLYNPLVHLFEWIKFPTTGIYYSFIDLNYFLNFLFWMFILSPIIIKIHSNKIKTDGS